MKKLMKVRQVVKIDVPGLGKRIKEAREADRRSLAVICREVGMTTANWYRIEMEKQEVPLATLQRMEEVLGVSFGITLEMLVEDTRSKGLEGVK